MNDLKRHVFEDCLQRGRVGCHVYYHDNLVGVPPFTKFPALLEFGCPTDNASDVQTSEDGINTHMLWTSPLAPELRLHMFIPWEAIGSIMLTGGSFGAAWVIDGDIRPPEKRLPQRLLKLVQ